MNDAYCEKSLITSIFELEWDCDLYVLSLFSYTFVHVNQSCREVFDMISYAVHESFWMWIGYSVLQYHANVNVTLCFSIMPSHREVLSPLTTPNIPHHVYMYVYYFSIMPSHREVLSPLTTPNIPHQSLGSRFISPSTSRHVSLKSPVPMLTAEHDDAAEKRERRRSRIIQLQQSAASPLSPTDRWDIIYRKMWEAAVTHHTTQAECG